MLVGASFVLGMATPLVSHAETLILTDPKSYSVGNPFQGGCCQNSTVASTTEQAPSPFHISRLQLDNEDFSANNHDGFGNVRAWLYDAQDNLIASSTNTCYGEGACNTSLNFSRELIPATFIVRLRLDDLLQGGANFTISNLRFYEDVTPTLPGLNQRKPNATGTITESAQTIDNPVAFEGTAMSPGGLQVKLQIELEPFNQAFTNTPNIESGFALSGSLITMSTSTLIDGAYHWQARIIDEQNSSSPWQEFGANGNVDFVIKTSATFPEVYADTITLFSVQNNFAGGCCANFIMGTVAYHLPAGFLITSILVNNSDSSGNNHSGSGNVRAWLYDVNNNVIASSTNSCYGEGGCAVFNFNGELIPQDFKLSLVGDDALQGGASFTIRNVTFFGNPATPPREPVIIVPGIMGTRLNRVSDGKEVWPNGDKMFFSFSDDYLDDLKLSTTSQQIQGKEMATGEIIDEALLTDVYENLINHFIDGGYASGTTLFTVPYDWRLDLRDELKRLDDKIQEALRNSSTGKINIIAHSMGGVLVKAYLAHATSTNFIDKLILAGVPQLGAPMAFKALNYGDNLGFDIGPFNILNPDRVKIIAQNMPGVYELLPSRRYLQVNGSYARDVRNGTTALDYDQTNAFMVSNASDTRNPLLLDLADTFHQGLDGQPFNVNASSVYNIVGCQNPQTLGEIFIKDNGKFEPNPTNGDGRVPIFSAMNLSNSFSNYFVRSDVTGIDHFGLTSNNLTVNLMKNIIEGNTANSLPLGIATSTSYCFVTLSDFINETTISVATFSPVALHAYDIQQRHTGPLPNGDIEFGIPGSSYEKIGENSFIFLPAGNTYRFVADGLDTGTFDMKIRGYKGSSIDNTITYLNVPLASNKTNAEVDFTSTTSPSDLKLDKDGDGTFETTVPPTALLSASSSLDETPPVIAINSPTSTDYLHSQIIPMNINATDTESGVAFTEIKLDGILTTSTAIDAFFQNLGEHALSVHVVDNAGNPTTAPTTFRIIATPESVISDIERAYTLGWITKKDIKKDLIEKIKSIIKIEKKIEIIKERLPNGRMIERRIEKLEKRIDRILAKLLLKEIAKWHDRHFITDQGYNILKEDIEWLIAN